MLARLITELRQRLFARKSALKSIADAARNRADWIVAADAYRSYLAQEPGDAGAHNDFGTVLCEQGRYDAAKEAFSTALACDARLFAAHLNLGHLALQQSRDYQEAISHYLSVLEIFPGQPDANRQVSLAYYELGEVDRALHHLNAAPVVPYDALSAEYSLFMTNALAGHDRQAHYDAHRRWAAPMDAMAVKIGSSGQRRSSNFTGRVRVGYASADFREHAVVRFLLPVLERHQTRDFEVFCYANQTEVDNVTLNIQRMPLTWRNIHSLSDDKVADMIVQDRIDILVDLSGHTRGNRLGVFALEPSGIQVTWLGYLNTTGMKAIDYRITDSRLDPPGIADRLHTEKLIRLDPASWCYRAPEDAPAIIPPPCESNGYITFGSFNHVAKLNHEVLECWSQVLAQIPNSRLKLLGVDEDVVARRLAEPFLRRGIASARLQMCKRLPRKEFFCEMADTDIALDPFPYCGGATTCESLWMGLPVTALAGDIGFSRSSSAIMAQAGMEEFIAGSQEAYVRNAVALADGGLSALRFSLRDRMRSSELMNEHGFVQRLETAYRKMLTHRLSQ